MTQSRDADDMVLETLLSVGRELCPDLPDSLLRRVFELQRVHQFDSDRAASLAELQHAVEEFVAQTVGTEATE